MLIPTCCTILHFKEIPAVASTDCKVADKVFPFSCRGHFLLGFFDRFVDTIAQAVWLLCLFLVCFGSFSPRTKISRRPSRTCFPVPPQDGSGSSQATRAIPRNAVDSVAASLHNARTMTTFVATLCADFGTSREVANQVRQAAQVLLVHPAR